MALNMKMYFYYKYFWSKWYCGICQGVNEQISWKSYKKWIIIFDGYHLYESY